MDAPILSIDLRLEPDVVLARQRARELAGLLGFDGQDQTRIGTAVSELARNAYRYAGGGKIDFFLLDDSPARLNIRVRDEGPGIKDLNAILEGRYTSTTGMGAGLIGVRRLMDDFHVQTEVGKGTSVEIVKYLPRSLLGTKPPEARVVQQQLRDRPPDSALEEVQRQNEELLRTLEILQARQEELKQLNQELDDTNRGVVALYAELDEKADYLRRASEMKTRFLSNMTHEFRTPLNSILSLTRLLLDRIDGDLSIEQEKQVNFIRKAAEDLSELVNDLLDLAKVEAGKVVVRASEFEVAALFGALRGMLRPLLAHNSSVALLFEDGEELPLLTTDESKVSQILRNFISNALKFTERGEVRVSARVGRSDTMVFSVSDTGIGIAPEDHERIFQEFTQVDNARQRRVKGTGLGLPLSRKLAELLGGGVSLQSTPGAGSTFSLTVPRIYRGPGEVSIAPEVAAQPDATRWPVLVVEDNRETVFVYEKLLKGTGFQLVGARTVAEARRALARFRPIAVVLDILLEGESAWDFLNEIKANPTTANIPVLVVTVLDNQEKALAMGADGFCAKPVDRGWLLDKLNEARPTRLDKLLIIDDDEVSRYLLKGLLTSTRFEVIEAAGGQEGLARARQHRPQVIFLDLVMPDLDGPSVLHNLKSDAETRAIPVIIHTSKVLNAEERKRLEGEAVAILPKDNPSREQAQTRLREALGRAGVGTRENEHV